MECFDNRSDCNKLVRIVLKIINGLNYQTFCNSLQKLTVFGYFVIVAKIEYADNAIENIRLLHFS